MKKKLLSILLVTAMVATMAAGCGGSGDSASESEEGGGNSITVLVESGSPAEALANETAADFEEETGCKVIVDAVAYTGMYDKLSTEIKAGEAAHDVACMDFVWLAAFADAIEPVADADTSDFLPTLEESGTIDGNLLGYPRRFPSMVPLSSSVGRKSLVSASATGSMASAKAASHTKSMQATSCAASPALISVESLSYIPV